MPQDAGGGDHGRAREVGPALALLSREVPVQTTKSPSINIYLTYGLGSILAITTIGLAAFKSRKHPGNGENKEG